MNKTLDKLKNILGSRSIRYAIVFCLLSILIWAIFCIPSFAAYPPDGNTYIVIGHGLVEYQIPQKDFIPGNSICCQFNIYNVNPQNQNQNFILHTITDNFSQPVNKSDEPTDGKTYLYQYNSNDARAFQDVLIHYIVSPDVNNADPQVGIKCWQNVMSTCS